MSGDVVSDEAIVPRTRVRDLGPWQAIWLVVGFEVMQFATGFGLSFAAGFVQGFSNALRHVSASFSPSPQFQSVSVFASYILAGLWSYWFVQRRAASRLDDGSPSGVGLRAAPLLGYAAAAVLALALVGVVALVFWLVPPTSVDSQLTLLLTRALSGTGNSQVLLLILAIATVFAVGPVLEEFIFRGAAFAGVAGRWGTPAASIITTALFVLGHASEKIHYLPGFLDVALLALASLWLRLHYRSIRPAMLCHALYNVGVLALAWLFSA